MMLDIYVVCVIDFSSIIQCNNILSTICPKQYKNEQHNNSNLQLQNEVL